MANRKPYPQRQYPNWAELDPSIDRLLAEGRNVADIAKDLDLKPDTVRAHLRKRETTGTPSGHQGTPEPTEISSDEQYTQEHPDTPLDADQTEVHHGTLEGHQEVMEDISQSVPDAPHIGAEETFQSTPEHPSTPEVAQELSVDDSGVPEHSGVPARQEWPAEVPAVHPGTPTAEDWELWVTIKARWLEVEKMLADRQVLRSTPGTPGHTQKKTYVFDVRHVGLIEAYAQANRSELKDVIYMMCEEFFQRR